MYLFYIEEQVNQDYSLHYVKPDDIIWAEKLIQMLSSSQQWFCGCWSVCCILFIVYNRQQTCCCHQSYLQHNRNTHRTHTHILKHTLRRHLCLYQWWDTGTHLGCCQRWSRTTWWLSWITISNPPAHVLVPEGASAGEYERWLSNCHPPALWYIQLCIIIKHTRARRVRNEKQKLEHVVQSLTCKNCDTKRLLLVCVCASYYAPHGSGVAMETGDI